MKAGMFFMKADVGYKFKAFSARRAGGYIKIYAHGKKISMILSPTSSTHLAIAELDLKKAKKIKNAINKAIRELSKRKKEVAK